MYHVWYLHCAIMAETEGNRRIAEGYHFVRPYETSVACKMVRKETLPDGNGKNAEDTDLSG